MINLKKIKGDSLVVYPKIVKQLQRKENGFILSGLNLAFIGFIDKIEPDRRFKLWPDGIFSKLFINK